MISLSDIAVTAKIYESANSLVYRGIQQEDKTSVILKVLKQGYPTPAELARYKQEYEIIRSLNLEGVIKAYSLQNYQRTLVIILEDCGGESLEKLSKRSLTGSSRMPLDEFLQLAIRITEILGRIHAANVIHKDINPSNIVMNPDTGVVKIIDFGISTRLARTNPTFNNANVLEGTLAYMSPEQTGRMNRFLDYRTDFYSLGVTFYKLLTGQLPFTTTDVLELVHCHIAKQPTPPNQVNLEIPPVVSEIVMKLMAKNAEERYQSAWGIKADLEACLAQLQHSGTITQFPIARLDISDKFQIPQKLYGREAEVKTLLSAFERVCGEGVTTDSSPLPSSIEMMLVTGYSGIGKSALVQEIYKPITEKRGYFISGKFDQFQRNIPYSAVVSAFRGLMQQLLSETQAEIQQWREKLLAALGINGQVIIDVIPEVELIIGKQPPVPKVGSTECQNRFNLAFQKFISVFCSSEHPLVLFLDDLQWVDSATLKLIELIMRWSEARHLFLIGAYRDNEVSSFHPLSIALEELRKQGAIINQISLAPLKIGAIAHLISDTLQRDLSAVSSLADLVLQKTGGNPFFVNEFLKKLYADNLLSFDPPEPPLAQGGWQWDITQIEAQNITDNVVELMISQLKQLPESTQQILCLAACVGAAFDLKTLAAICEQPQHEVLFQVTIAIQEGLILPISELDENLLIQDYKFLHDRVQQAAHALIDENQKQAIHLQIGRNLLHNVSDETLSEELFKIVDHLDQGVKLLTDQEERLKIASLNLMAGQKAKAALAYISAKRYLTKGIELLAPNSWELDYDLSLALHEVATEVAYLCSDFNQMEQWATIVLHEAKTILDKIKIYDVKIRTYIAQSSKLLEAIKIGLQVLEVLGVSLPESPKESDIQQALSETKVLLNGKNIEDLVNLPIMTDADKVATMHILSFIFSPAYHAAPALYSLVVCEKVKLSIKYGNSPCSAFAYAAYGGILNGLLQDTQSAYQFGMLALSLVEQFNLKSLESRIFHSVALYIFHGKFHVRDTLSLSEKAYSSGIESGDFTYASYAAEIRCQHLYWSGLELNELEREMATTSHAIAQLGQEAALNYHQIYWQVILNLRGQAENPCYLLGSAYNEEKLLPLHLAVNDRTGLHLFYLNKLILCYLFGNFVHAIENATYAEQYLEGVIGQITVPVFHFYDSLARLAVYFSIQSLEQKYLLLKVTSNQEKMQKWAQDAPMNYRHKYSLVEAEKARILGQVLKAEEFYEQAIKGASENGYIQEEALAYELAAKFYLERGMEKFAQTYIKEAQYCYERWGATAKVKYLEATYPQLLTQTSTATYTINTSTTNSRTTTSNYSGISLDLAAVIKAFQAISSEIVLDKLLSSLMKILMENAGAQIGFLLMEESGEWAIKASGKVGSGQWGVTAVDESPSIKHLASMGSELEQPAVEKLHINYPPYPTLDTVCSSGELQPISINNYFPRSIINYVIHTQESVVLNDATCEGNFTQDSYIQTRQTKSILCTPLLNQGKLIGILYLENNLTVGAFPQERVQVLNGLSSQAAISIENATLYNQLEQKVTQRTAELALATQQAQVANKAKSAFLANMSHELRTPLNAILGFSQLMNRSSDLSPEHQEHLSIINRSGEHLLTLINQVLDLSKIEAGLTILNEESFDLHRLLSDVENMFRLKAEGKGLQLVFEQTKEVPQYVRTDQVKLYQVLINLLSNAIKFTKRGKVVVRVRLGYEEEEMSYSQLHFEVEDTGLGIAPDELDSLFEAFVQTRSGQQFQEGTGLGLTIARSFVRLMGGDMSVISQVGKGSIFQFDIQVNLVEPTSIKRQQTKHRVIGLEPNQPSYRILVADDQSDNRQLLVKLLSPLGFELQEASNGQEAIAIWEQWQPHLIFIDMRMPVTSGVEVTQRIKATPPSLSTVKNTATSACAIIAVTASSLEQERAMFLQAGGDGFISKPFREADIFDTLHNQIGVRFIYDETTSTPASSGTEMSVLTPVAIASLPPDLIADLYEAILNLNLKLMHTLIAKIHELNEPLADAIFVLVKKFQYEQLLELIQSVSEPT